MIPPGSTIGMLGSGQLGRMFVHAAQAMGYRVHVYSPEANAPAGQAADQESVGSWDDHDAIRAFATQVQVVTLEFENISAAAANVLSEVVPVRPGPNVLHVAQNRIREKTTISSFGLPVPDFAVIESVDDVVSFLEKHAEHGAVLKSAESGYDGKGQARVKNAGEAADGLAAVGTGPVIIEEFVPYRFEASVISARSPRGEVRSYEPFVNAHANHILDVSVSPSPLISEDLRARLVDAAENLMQSLEVVGVLCVEFFYSEDDRILINEVAPRPHNSGHLTIEGCVTSQFEQQVRAVCDLPLGSTKPVRPTAMANLLGQHLPQGPIPAELFTEPNVKLHLYGKAEARPARKMGHITATGETAEAAESAVRAARDRIAP